MVQNVFNNVQANILLFAKLCPYPTCQLPNIIIDSVIDSQIKYSIVVLINYIVPGKWRCYYSSCFYTVVPLCKPYAVTVVILSNSKLNCHSQW